jgi:hypothetical protein
MIEIQFPIGTRFYFLFSKRPVSPWDRTDLLLYGKSGRGGKVTTSSKVELVDKKNYTSTPHMPLMLRKRSLCFQTSCLWCFNKRTVSVCHHENEPIEEYIIRYEPESAM